MKIKLIVAKAKNNVIGKDNDLIWHLPADMRFFTQTTKGHIVLMGRKNWDSIPEKYRPLSQRENVVVTRNKNFSHPDCTTFHSIEEALAHYTKAKDDTRDLFIIGGGQIYKYCLEHDLLDELLITYIDHEFDGDTYFPEVDETQWDKHLLIHHPTDEKNAHSFEVYQFVKP